jgi:hypothetical protein
MMRVMRTKLLSIVAAIVLAGPAMPAMAQSDDETPKDARNEGFARDGGGPVSSIALAPSGTAGTWFMCVGLGVLLFGVMSKNSKRTHLD